MPCPQQAAAGLLLVLAALGGAGASRVKVSDQLQTEGGLTVELLVTRHALSCANVVSKWGGRLFDNRKVADPVLCAAGFRGSKDMAGQFKGDKPDRVLSSVLVRAMETAMLQYPGEPVAVVPHIREGGSGVANSVFSRLVKDKDNFPVSEALQQKKLENDGLAKVQTSSWFKENQDLREANGDWPSFLTFLGKDYLPPWRRSHPGPAKIILAVVTHSQFMADADDLKSQCGHLWQHHPGSKPLNNQAVRITYKATWSNSAFTLSLDKDTKCEQAAPGVLYKKGSSICKGDIGPVCEAELKEQGVSVPQTTEDKIELLEKEREEMKVKIAMMKVEAHDKIIATSSEEENAKVWANAKEIEEEWETNDGQRIAEKIELLKKESCL